MKQPYVWFLVVLFLTPFGFRFAFGKHLRLALEDPRPIFAAEKLESIRGVQAGGRVERQFLQKDITYVVKSGDSWWSIAQRYKVRDASNLAVVNNNIALVPGAKVIIPAGMVEQQP